MNKGRSFFGKCSLCEGRKLVSNIITLWRGGSHEITSQWCYQCTIEQSLITLECHDCDACERDSYFNDSIKFIRRHVDGPLSKLYYIPETACAGCLSSTCTGHDEITVFNVVKTLVSFPEHGCWLGIEDNILYTCPMKQDGTPDLDSAGVIEVTAIMGMSNEANDREFLRAVNAYFETRFTEDQFAGR